jgi:hypothetical protein
MGELRGPVVRSDEEDDQQKQEMLEELLRRLAVINMLRDMGLMR